MFENDINSLCFSGGGTKGIVFVGAIQALIDKKVIELEKINHYIGASAGSLISFCFCIGYKPIEIKTFLIEFNFKVLEPEIDSDNLFNGYGIDNGLKFLYIIRMLAKAKIGVENISFRELYELTNKKLTVTVTSINNSLVKYLNYETAPDHDVILAIRMSTSVPFYYMPVNYNNELYIDGGILDNYPIQEGEKNKTIGLVVASETDIKINDFGDYMFATIRLVVNAYLLAKVRKYSNCSISILCDEKSFLDFEMTKEAKTDMIEQGYNVVIEKYNIFVEKKIKTILNDIIDKVIDDQEKTKN